MHIKGVVFDLDHTLYDRDTADRETMGRYFDEYRALFSKDCTRENAREGMVWAEHAFAHRGWARIVEGLTERGVFVSPPETSAFCDYFQESYIASAKLFPFVLPTFERLKGMGMKLGLITNGREARQRRKIAALGLADAFDLILHGSAPDTAKPLPARFNEMAERLFIPAESLMYVGDNPKNDVEGSRQAGYVPVWVRTMPWDFPEFARAPFEVDGIDELPQMIAQINDMREEPLSCGGKK